MGRRKTVALAERQPRSQLTYSQQGHLRSKLMTTASAIAHQLDEYITTGKVIVAGREVRVDATRLRAYEAVLERTVPALSSTVIEHRSPIEGVGTEALVARLAELMKARPELKARLLEALGEKVIDSGPSGA